MTAFGGVNGKLTDRVALVTGAEKGIGKEISLQLAQLGARLALCVAPDEVSVAERFVREELPSSGAQLFAADLANTQAIVRLVSNVWSAFGRIDIVVNNAATRQFGPALGVSEDAWDRLMAINLKAPYFICQNVGRRMIDSGIRGSIVNVASQLGVVVARDLSLYCISKSGLIALTKALALEFARHGIVVNSVAPGPTNTAGSGLLRDEVEAVEFLHRMPLGRRIEPSEVAGAVAYLAAAGGGAITGHTLLVDGGWTLW